jgi:hypothetical protein
MRGRGRGVAESQPMSSAVHWPQINFVDLTLYLTGPGVSLGRGYRAGLPRHPGPAQDPRLQALGHCRAPARYYQNRGAL